MEVYVIRHTAVAVGGGICYGQSELGLASSFEEELQQYKLELGAVGPFDLVYSSPLGRCRILAEALNLGVELIFEPRLMEMNFGLWEGRAWSDIEAEALNKWMGDFVEERTPEGECLRDLYERVGAFLEVLRLGQADRVLLVCHAGVIRCIWAYLLGIPLGQVFKLGVGFGEILSFDLGREPSFDKLKRLQ